MNYPIEVFFLFEKMNFNAAILQKHYNEIYFSCDTYVKYWSYTKEFCKMIIKLDMHIRIQIYKKMLKILENPERQQHLSANRKDEIEVRIGSFRAYAKYNKKENLVTFSEYSHKDEQ